MSLEEKLLNDGLCAFSVSLGETHHSSKWLYHLHLHWQTIRVSGSLYGRRLTLAILGDGSGVSGCFKWRVPDN